MNMAAFSKAIESATAFRTYSTRRNSEPALADDATKRCEPSLLMGQSPKEQLQAWAAYMGMGAQVHG